MDLWGNALRVLVLVAGPVVGVALIVGLLTSLLQAATQLNDSALSFVPKVAALILVMALGGSWLLGHLERHLSGSITHLAEMGPGRER
ncbi:MAG: flagellar biosynthetic protein FliQ [Kofleriaceae bacterium]|nr:flagellar biosynthetic protein FliQ [Kofleriaceae bacterium]